MSKAIDYYLSLDYPVEILRIDAKLGGGYLATIPFLGSHAFVGDGETPQEAYDNLQQAKVEIFEDYIAEGLPIPEPPVPIDYEDYSGKFVVRMPRELHAKLAAAAKRNDTSLNQFILYALSSFEAKWDATQEIKHALLTTESSFVTTWIGTPANKSANGAEPCGFVDGSKGSKPWTSISPSSATTQIPATNLTH